MRRLVLSIVVISALLGAGAVAALATPGSAGQAAAAGRQMGRVGMRLEVSKFVRHGHSLIAKGKAVATYSSGSEPPNVQTKSFSAHATVLRRGRTLAGTSQTATCPVLTLELDTVSLDLLGLHVDLSKVILTITADPNGGTLGKLFCNLASGKTAVASTSTARSLTSAARRSGLSSRGVAFGTPTRELQALGPGPCSIVDLLLGPLHLELLGLIVDLNQIHLQITADPNEPPLGSLLCSVVSPPTTTTAPTTT